jgi:hypothetical protein
MRVARFCGSSGTIDGSPVGWPSGWSWSSYGAPFVLYGRRACCVPGYGAEVEPPDRLDVPANDEPDLASRRVLLIVGAAGTMPSEVRRDDEGQDR